MANKLILAVAGAGKTTIIGKTINPNDTNLVITYTNRNVENLVDSIRKNNYGKIPSNTFVMTYTKFLYNWIIRPFENTISSNFNIPNIDSSGIDISSPPENNIYKNNGYKKKNDINHYLSVSSNGMYASRLSELFDYCNSKYKKKVNDRISKFVDCIYVDEFQDFVGYDFKLIQYITKNDNLKLLLYGDFYQSMVSPSSIKTHIPYEKDDNVNKFKRKISGGKNKLNVLVDENTLSQSWRVPEKTCEFINEYLNIDIKHNLKSDNSGSVIFIKDVLTAYKILNDKSIVKLYWNKNIKGYDLFPNKNNWSYSKGDTYDCTCIIMTSKISSMINKGTKVGLSTLNKFYVALTRSKGNTYIIDSNLVKKVINIYFQS